MRLFLTAAVCWAVLATAAGATADLSADARRLQEDLVTQRAMAIAHERRLTSAGDEVLLARLDVAEHAIRLKARDLAHTQAERDTARAELTPVIAERDRLQVQFAERDDAYAAEVAEYRRQIDGLLHTSDPKLTEALQRFADGDRVGAFPVIESIMRAQIKASEAAVNEQSAVQLRQLAGLADDMRARGEKTAAEVLAIWEEAQHHTPNYSKGWLALSDLYASSGNAPRALDCAKRALETARGDRERAAALVMLGEAEQSMGDLASARSRFDEGLAIVKRALAAAPTDQAKQRDVAVLFIKLAGVLQPLGDLPGARQALEQSLALLSPMAKAHPDNTLAERDIATALVQLGEVFEASGDFSAALVRYEATALIARKLALDEPQDGPRKRFLGGALSEVGDARVAMADYAGAQAAYVEAAAILRRQAAADPGDAQAQRDAAVVIHNTAIAKSLLNDLQGAKTLYEESLAIARRLQAADPRNLSNGGVMADNLIGLTEVAKLSGDAAAARARSDEVVAVRRELLRADPVNVAARSALSLALMQSADIALLARDLPRAKATFDESLALQKSLVDAKPGDIAARGRLATTLSLIGDSLMRARDQPTATQHYREAVAVTRALLLTDPDNGGALKILALDLGNLGRLAAARDDYTEATADYLEAVPVLRRLEKQAPSVAQPELQQALVMLGNLSAVTQKFDAAARYYGQSIDLGRQLAIESPGSADIERSLAEGYSRLATVKGLANDPGGARLTMGLAAAQYRHLAARTAAPASDQRELGVTLNELASMDYDQRDAQAAGEHYTEAMALWRRYSGAHPEDTKALRSYAVVSYQLATLTEDRSLWVQSVTLLEALDSAGKLDAKDRPFLERARAHLAPAGATP